jgi:hypothetical protein
MVVMSITPSTQDSEAGRLRVLSQPGPHSKTLSEEEGREGERKEGRKEDWNC